MKKQMMTVAIIAAVSAMSAISAFAAEGDGSLARVQEAGKLIIGTEGTYAPFTFYEEDKLVGYDVEIAEAVCEILGVEPEFIESTWDGMISGLDAKRWDTVFNQVTITEARLEKYAFSTPYTFAHGALIVAADNEDLKTFEDLKGNTVAASLTSDWATMAEEFGGSVEGTNEFTESVTLVETGRADAVLNDELVFYDYVETTGDEKIKIVALTDDVNKNAALFRQEDAELAQAVSDALAQLAEDGTLKEISEKYFGVDLSVE